MEINWVDGFVINVRIVNGAAVISGASHTDLYDGGGKNAIPFDKLQSFFEKYLG